MRLEYIRTNGRRRCQQVVHVMPADREVNEPKGASSGQTEKPRNPNNFGGPEVAAEKIQLNRVEV
jgi:hypothetical protein